MRRGPYRLDSGGLIDRSQAVPFTFNAKSMVGFAGDTLASALLANHVRVVSRSMKFHRPRGVLTCGPEEPNALVQLSRGAKSVPSARATMTSLEAGMEATTQSGWPSLQFDVLRALDAVAPMLAAGFYNKTFMWPSWHWFEPAIRQLAGLGRAPADADPDQYEVRNAHCDVLIVGGGVAGLSAALGAARRGLSVLLVEQDKRLGGEVRWSAAIIGGQESTEWIRGAEAELLRAETVRILLGTAAVGAHGHGVITLNETCQEDFPVRERFWIVRARRVVLATGAVEQPLIFDHNDRPGIMLAGAAHRYLKCHAISPGRRVVVATNNDSAYVVARDLIAASVNVAAVIDSRAEVSSSITAELLAAGVSMHRGMLPQTTSGSTHLKSIMVRSLPSGSPSGGQELSFNCDALIVSGGWSPSLHLYAQSGGKLIYDDTLRALVPTVVVPSIQIVGMAAGQRNVDAVIQHAETCGAEGAPVSPESSLPRPSKGEVGPRISPRGNIWRQWVDLRHDVTAGDIKLALQENYRSIEHIKRYTTVGMSVDQGKTSSAVTIELAAAMQGISTASIGHTTMRPPVMPVTLGAIAGRGRGHLFSAWRRTAIHEWHTSHGGLLEPYGDWQRAACYAKPGESRADAIKREMRVVREAAGLFDASPLGKIEVRGPDAREFLDRFYINRLDTLQAGRVRYAIMLHENGVIFDDGTVTLLDPCHLLITTTSGNAARVASWLDEWHQCEWPSMRVVITEVTEQWATMSLSGPRSRGILEKLRPSCDLSPVAFPHLAMRTATILGLPARIYRVSFSGELTYEINIPAEEAVRVWEALIFEGRSEGIEPYGIEALLLLRLEKGYLHVGTDTDGTTVPDDIGWGPVASGKARDYVGKRSLSIPENLRADRLQLVGLRGRTAAGFIVGSHVRLANSKNPSDGWITSAGRLEPEGEDIALALVRAGRARMNEEVTVLDSGRQLGSATIVTPPFYDQSGARLNV